MPRKEATVRIDTPGRDSGKVFFLRELPATQAEKWAARLLLAVGQSGAQIPDDVAQAGIAGAATLGLRALAGIPWHMAEPLMDEMMSCVQIIPDPAHPQVIRPLIEDDIEEVSTRIKLRDEIIALHVGFSLGAYLSTFRERWAARTAPGNTPATPTSQAA